MHNNGKNEEGLGEREEFSLKLGEERDAGSLAPPQPWSRLLICKRLTPKMDSIFCRNITTL